MLKGIPKILSPELLKVLCEMGHGDRLVIADGNFPSASVGKNAAKCIAEDRIEDKTLKNPEAKTCPKFEIYLDKAGLFRYRLFATNGESIAISEDGYKSKSGCINGMKSVSVNAIDAEIIDETVAKK